MQKIYNKIDKIRVLLEEDTVDSVDVTNNLDPVGPTYVIDSNSLEIIHNKLDTIIMKLNNTKIGDYNNNLTDITESDQQEPMLRDMMKHKILCNIFFPYYFEINNMIDQLDHDKLFNLFQTINKN
jgi:hypothetical protein